MAERKRRYFDVIEGDGAAAPGPMPLRVGDMLRNRREELGYDLPAMAKALRIRLPYLEAIEQCRYGDLPGQAYVTGFLRTYALALGLDAGQILRKYKDETANVPQSAELYFPEPVNENRVPAGAVILIALLLAGLVYGGWYVTTSNGGGIAGVVQPLPDRLSRLIDGNEPPPAAPAPAGVLAPGEAERLVGQSTPTAPEVGAPAADAAPQPAAPTATNPTAAAPTAAPEQAAPVQANAQPAPASPAPVTAPPQPAQVPPAAQAPATQAAASPPAPADEEEVAPIPDVTGQGGETLAEAAPATAAPTVTEPNLSSGTLPSGGRVFGQTEGPARVIIRATEQSWIEVRDAKGTLWASRILRPGDEFRAPDVPGLSMTTGNAGGVSISLDGRELPPLGEKGRVVRDVSLVPGELERR